MRCKQIKKNNEIYTGCLVHFNFGWRAAWASSGRDTFGRRGASLKLSGSSWPFLEMDFIASINISRVSLDSVSVGSIIKAPFTINGKYTVGG